ncbi:MAG: Asp-tRNA(Asn)/Glu-tRNA(Gln) amidotransferase GatCAB subunit B, partial [bacterium]
ENKQSISEFAIQPQRLADLIALVESGVISGNIAKKVFDAMLESEKSPGEIIDEKGLKQISDTGELESLVDEILASHPSEVERYRNGEQKLMGFFVGQLMRATKGKANPKVVNALLREKLG